MFNFKRKLPSFNAVAPNSTATVNAPTGPTYQAITLLYKRAGVAATEAQVKSDLKRIRIKINGVTRFDVSGKHVIDVLNKYYGIAFTNGLLTIPLSRPWHKTMEGEDNLAWGTKNVQTLGIEVDIDGAAVSPTLVGEAFILPYERDLGSIIQVHEMPFSTSVAGMFEISTLPKGNGDLASLHFDSALVTAAEVFLNQVPASEGDESINRSLLTWVGERTPQANYVHIDPLLKNRVSDVWPLAGVQDFRAKLTMSGAGAVDIIMETLNAPLAKSA